MTYTLERQIHGQTFRNLNLDICSLLFIANNSGFLRFGCEVRHGSLVPELIFIEFGGILLFVLIGNTWITKWLNSGRWGNGASVKSGDEGIVQVCKFLQCYSPGGVIVYLIHQIRSSLYIHTFQLVKINTFSYEIIILVLC